MWPGNEPGDAEEQRMRRIAMLQRVIVEIHSCSAQHLETAHVAETFLGRTIWEGDVEVFAVLGHPRARRCYAWVKRIGGLKRARFFAVLETTVIRTALDAVKFAHISTNAPLIDEFSKLAEHDYRLPP